MRLTPECGSVHTHSVLCDGKGTLAEMAAAAFAAGVSPELVGDAVTLAVQAAREEGEATEEAVAAALEQVLRRHPGWRAAARRAGNFRLGADEPAAPRPAAPAQDAPKRWNRFR